MEIALIAIRFAHYTAVLMLFGGLVFARLVAPGVLGRRIASRLALFWQGCAATAAATSVLWLMLVSASTGDGIADAISVTMLSTIAFETTFGTIWCWHMLVCMAVLVCLVSYARRHAQIPSRGALIAAGAGLLSLAPTGHAMMREGWEGAAAIVSQAVHLLAAGYWVGSLPPVGLTLMATRGDLRTDGVAALKRFSEIGHFAVGFAILSGLFNLYAISGNHPLALAAPYAALALAKSTVVAAMVLLALINRYRLVPHARSDGYSLNRMQVLTHAILALGLGAIGLVSVFGMLSPT